MEELKFVWVDEEIKYTGSELRPHFLLEKFNIRGSALAAFVGPCDVQTAELVDWEDRLAHDTIRARKMVHFIGEFFGADLKRIVLMQRLWIACIAESLAEALPSETQIRRDGDDIYIAGRKLTVSIVTASPVSQLLHIGVNLDPTGAPVAAIGLSELGVLPQGWVQSLFGRMSREWSGIEWACAKVRPVI